MPTKNRKPLNQSRNFLSSFAGGGLSRLGLGKNWECTFAKRFLAQKGLAAYRENF